MYATKTVKFYNYRAEAVPEDNVHGIDFFIYSIFKRLKIQDQITLKYR